MGSEKTSTSGQTSQQTQYTPTAAETGMQNLEYSNMQANNPMNQQNMAQMQSLVSSLLTGGSLPGYFNTLAKGIDSNAIAAQAGEMGRQAMPSYQSGGILDSGMAQRDISTRIANQLLYPTEQFNIGSLQNLMNMAMGGQAQVQSQQQAGIGTLGEQLAGLRSVSQTGSSNQTTYGMNPFLKSFQQSAGKTLGSPKFSMGPFSMGG
jgi:hypothetical protein